MKAKKMAMTMAAIALVGAVGIGSTMAYLTDKTGTVTNTFTVGNVQITLDESEVKYTPGTGYEIGDSDDENATVDRVTGNAYVNLVPGDTIAKDPTVTVKANSVPSYVFVKVEDTNTADASYLAYEIANGWTALENVAGVYYRTVDKSNEDQAIKVIKNDLVTYSINADASTAEQNIKVTAYAIQSAHIEKNQGEDEAHAAYRIVSAN